MTDERGSQVDAVDAIWNDDLLGRRAEADVLIGYLESVNARSKSLSDGRAFTIAVDCGYGQGKTFFLRRLARQLALNHPVAFVDAWGDDLADEPLTALAATLKSAMEPLLQQPQIRSKFASFVSKTGRVAKIAGAGLFRRGLGLLITGPAVDAAGEVMSSASDDVRGAVNAGLAEASKGVVDDSAEGLEKERAASVMNARIREFEEGQVAIREMKDSLASIVTSLQDQSLTSPICIIIDELDRCRPTYAVKLLEEVKHLFDVPGLVFIFGLHGDQLAHSVCGAYGSGFDGKAYLRRFLNRRYSLNEPPLANLLHYLLQETSLSPSNFVYPLCSPPGLRTANELSPAAFIAEYMRVYDLSARDSFEVTDILQTCAALADPHGLHLAYLLPLIFSHMKQTGRLALPPILKTPLWNLVTPSEDGNYATLSIDNLASEYEKISFLDNKSLRDQFNEENCDYVTYTIFENRSHQPMKNNYLSQVDQYRNLISTVARFKNPSLETESDS
jgi:hypothetical protein